MAVDKAMLKIGEVKLIEKIAAEINPYFKEIFISRGNGNREPDPGDTLPAYPAVYDPVPGQGPLMGILMGLRASSSGVNFVLACDIPEIHLPFLFSMAAYTAEYDVVVPVTPDGKYEPLFAFYHRRLIPIIEEMLRNEERKIILLYPRCRVKTILLDNATHWYRNLNTRQDYLSYLTEKKGTGKKK